MRIVLNGKPRCLDGADPASSLLDWIRESAGLRGTKEGCAEGDCGACTVIRETIDATGNIRREVINSCITLLGQVDGSGIRTIEGLSSVSDPVHPIQQKLAEHGGTQCGFCTPGIAISSYVYAANNSKVSLEEIHDALAGNLCRCTGYRGIVQAIKAVTPLANDPTALNDRELIGILNSLETETRVAGDHEDIFMAPATLDELLALRAANLDASILAGGTDLALRVSRDRQSLGKVICVSRVPELNVLTESVSELVVGAAVSYSRAQEVLLRHYPELKSYYTRLGSAQIRNMGTIGGNLGTASPIGDSLPILIAAGADVNLASKSAGMRTLSVEQFLIGYRKTALLPDEVIVSVRIPIASKSEILLADKVSKRRDQDISTVCAAYWLQFDGKRLVEARIAYGGTGAVAQRAFGAENKLRGRVFDENSIDETETALRSELKPMSDFRASAEYRLDVAVNLLRRLQSRVADGSISAEKLST